MRKMAGSGAGNGGVHYAVEIPKGVPGVPSQTPADEEMAENLDPKR